MQFQQIVSQLPPEWPVDPMPEIQKRVDASAVKVVVFDDDPTGTQTVQQVDVLTTWGSSELQSALEDAEPVVYLLTNSRSLDGQAAAELMEELTGALKRAASAVGRPFVVVSRSDSTLRGHFPVETDVLSKELGPYDGLLLVPFFLEGGRFTIDGRHYVLEEGRLVSAAETEFARDTVFGYQHSDLRDWVEEKTEGAISRRKVRAIPLELIRTGGPAAVAQELYRLHDGLSCVIDAVSYRDLEVVVCALLRCEQRGQRFLYRTAASFVRTRGGLCRPSPLDSADLWRADARRGGLVVVGSHVARTTEQLEVALKAERTVGIEAKAQALLNASTKGQEVARLIAAANTAMDDGYTAIIYTSRELVRASELRDDLSIGQRISAGLVAVIDGLPRAPAWLIAKGGITSSDIATHGLRLDRARVLGQAIPGVPIWVTPASSRWPAMVYVVFPGNVGDSLALSDMIALLQASPYRPTALGAESRQEKP